MVKRKRSVREIREREFSVSSASSPCHIRSVEVPMLLCSRFAEHRQDHRRANNYRKRLRVHGGTDGEATKDGREDGGRTSLSFPPSARALVRARVRSRWRGRAFSHDANRTTDTSLSFFFSHFFLFSPAWADNGFVLRASGRRVRAAPQRI